MTADIEGQFASIAGDGVKKGSERGREKYTVQKGTAENDALVVNGTLQYEI